MAFEFTVDPSVSDVAERLRRRFFGSAELCDESGAARYGIGVMGINALGEAVDELKAVWRDPTAQPTPDEDAAEVRAAIERPVCCAQIRWF